MWQARRNTPGAPSTWPAPTTISRGAARPGSSASPRGREGDVSSALETFAQAVASLHAAGNLVDELSSTVVLADLWLAAGRPSTARRLYERALQLAEAHGERVARATADLHVGLSEIDVEVGDLDERQATPRRPPQRSESGPAMTEGRYRWFVAMGLARRGRGRPGGGRQPPGPGGAALPAGVLPGRATHRGDEGPGLDRAGQPVGGR